MAVHAGDSGRQGANVGNLGQHVRRKVRFGGSAVLNYEADSCIDLCTSPRGLPRERTPHDAEPQSVSRFKAQQRKALEDDRILWAEASESAKDLDRWTTSADLRRLRKCVTPVAAGAGAPDLSMISSRLWQRRVKADGGAPCCGAASCGA